MVFCVNDCDLAVTTAVAVIDPSHVFIIRCHDGQAIGNC
jgi:hypothetical protein